MKKEIRKIFFYVLMISIFGLLMYFVIQNGTLQQSVNDSVISSKKVSNFADGFKLFSNFTLQHIKSSIGILLLQIITILATCRIVGWFFKHIGQPTVIGEIVAGIILGPSVLGLFFPNVSSFLFPEESLPNIKILSEFGLILFMYIVGMELNLGSIKKLFPNNILISHASIILPFFLGTLISFFIYDKYSYPTTPFLPFALFIGISLSITAFPVLARILQEKGLMRTHLGRLALASAGDITAWCLLIAIIVYAQSGTIQSAVFNVIFSLIYFALMFFLVRPLLQIVGNLYHNKEVVNKSLVAFMFFILLVSSFIAEILGMHALFGAFIAGLVMPENLKFRKIMSEKVEDVSLALFLPLFFVYTGLQTQIGLLSNVDMWLLCGVFILIATIGKFGGAFVAARFSGETFKDSLYIGAMMNTRGLMELVVLTIGYEMRILSPTIFVMLVLMTIITTFMTSPLVSFIDLCFHKQEKMRLQREEKLKTDVFKVLLSFGRASNGQVMLDVAHQMFSQGKKHLDLTALHLTVGSDINPLHTENFEQFSFAPVLYEADKLGIQIQTKYDVCDNAEKHICSLVNRENFDFLLVGAGISMSDLSTDVTAHNIWKKFTRLIQGKASERFIFYPGSLIKDKTKNFIEQANCSVGVFVNRGFIHAEHILVIINSIQDLILLDYVKVLQRTSHGFVQLMNRTSSTSPDSATVSNLLNEYLDNSKDAAIPFEKNLTIDLLNEANLMLVSYDTWKILLEECDKELQDMPSTLIIQHK